MRTYSVAVGGLAEALIRQLGIRRGELQSASSRQGWRAADAAGAVSAEAGALRIGTVAQRTAAVGFETH